MAEPNDVTKKEDDGACKVDEPTSEKILNILLLGETGVGKSTFINSLHNYTLYNDYEEALSIPYLCALISSEFNITDKHGERHTVTIQGIEDENEILTSGYSATQDVKPYIFPVPNEEYKIRLIDTPGMGDTRGFQQDDVNCEKVINYISNLNEIHALCFLLKPTNTRLTPSFIYCLKKILSNLDKSAANNIIFCFTNTSGTHYEPGPTEYCLEKLINDIKNRPPHVEIPLDKNLFCFDNESFRYLAAIHDGIEFDDSVNDRNRKSWKISSNECLKMIKYITRLEPHNVESTVCISDARKTIMQLSKPLADIIENLEMNLRHLEEHERKLNDVNQSLAELKENLYAPVLTLDIKEIDYPATVCTSASCTEIVKVGSIKKINFKAKCHPQCYLKNVPKEFVGDSILKGCWAIHNEFCHQCRCHYTKHMHIYYITDIVEIKKVNSKVQYDINTDEGIMKEKKRVILEINQFMDELNAEYEFILKVSAQFAHFLQKNAITPFNDAYKEYINYLIDREKIDGENGDPAIINSLLEILEKYNKYKSSFDNALDTDSNYVAINPQVIQNTKDALFNLKHYGSKIKKLFDLQNIGAKYETKADDYVYDVNLSSNAGPTAKANPNSPNDINILLIGETGVGKSTFINSMANYLHFADIQDVMKAEKILALIPSDFTVKDVNGKTKKFKIGDIKDKNEYLSPGDSATQDVKSYVFPVPSNNIRIRLIDTPGMGDTRGTYQDDKNCENILAYVGELDTIHAFCFLLKPTETRIKTSFKYCIHKILTHLDKSAAKNIIFCYTNTRGAHYNAGATEDSLKVVLDNINSNPPHVKIPYGQNVFFFDNEALTWLAALKQDIEIKDEIFASMVQDWYQSSDECKRMFDYILGVGKQRGLQPHKVKNIVCVNDARKNIMKLSQPLADIAAVIDAKIALLERHRAKLNRAHQTIDEISANMYIPSFDLRITKMPGPATVCTNVNCIEKYTVQDAVLTHYKTICHENCYLKSVVMEILGDQSLLRCQAMIPDTGECRYCGCNFRFHMHIYYSTEVYDTTIKNKKAEVELETQESIVEKQKRITEEIDCQLTELKEEQSIIIETTARFAHFLKNNAITPFNDAHKEYLNQMILNEKAMGEDADFEKIKSLEESLKKHEQLLLSFQSALKRGSNNDKYSAKNISIWMNQLFQLKHSGENIRKMFHSQETARVKEHKANEYIHKDNIIIKKQGRNKHSKGNNPNDGHKLSYFGKVRQKVTNLKNKVWSGREQYSYDDNGQHFIPKQFNPEYAINEHEMRNDRDNYGACSRDVLESRTIQSHNYNSPYGDYSTTRRSYNDSLAERQMLSDNYLQQSSYSQNTNFKPIQAHFQRQPNYNGYDHEQFRTPGSTPPPIYQSTLSLNQLYYMDSLGNGYKNPVDVPSQYNNNSNSHMQRQQNYNGPNTSIFRIPVSTSPADHQSNLNLDLSNNQLQYMENVENVNNNAGGVPSQHSNDSSNPQTPTIPPKPRKCFYHLMMEGSNNI